MEGFSDLLEEIRHQGGPLLWLMQKKQFMENVEKKPKRSPDQIKRDVLNSDRLRHVISKILEKPSDSKPDRIEVEAEAKKIIDEMAHDFDLKYVRLLGFILIKVFSSIYKHIFYNSDIMDNMSILKHYPTVLLPLHRSYMDFLLISIVCYHKNLQLPTIAAGQDFLSMSFISKMIRHCGGFFIRRSFGSDELYWAIFREYVQQHLSNCDRPLEFFIEGTRSRTSKSLQPKLGMLSTCAELFMRGHRCQDIYFVPISLTYERLLEETLYSNELLGIPKPKESVSGLVKARTILNQSYGSIFVNFSRPISLREILFLTNGPSPSNSSNLLNPSFIFELNKDQFKQIESFSYLILIRMLHNQIIQPISIICTCLLLRNRSKFNSKLEINLNTLVEQRVRVYWPVGAQANSSTTLVLENLKTHQNLFHLDPLIALRQSEDLFESASTYIALCSYKNQLVNFLVRASFVSISLVLSSIDDELNRNQAFNIYTFMTRVFSKEFIFRPGDEARDFDDSFKYVINTSLLVERDHGLEINLFNAKKFIFFIVLFEKMFKNYAKIYSVLARLIPPDQNKFIIEDDKSIVKEIQTRIFNEMKSGSIKNDVLFDFEVLSLSTIGNAVSVLSLIGAAETKNSLQMDY
ncbi:dihydroxyacetone phosphate acyltransferase-like [Brachionus plicatilis]|uniref:Dihydroxyacetone phosphate acyltransferase-like n=1 Tax=Brachionus plicatilis TaxID=10195 RepID=A0A3M7QFX0_BRAPC|nr:dihydroxyacetone phosphate acyltransferase-like [Brachionus plicatilis]